jgi:glyoxylase-like metal-dependent hydrolase (beta-lactamase superfamily II)
MADEPYLCDPFLNLKDILGEGGNPGTPARLLSGGDVIEVGGMEIHIIHTPGHTPGGICLSIKREEILFTGDTLFNGGIGRTDLPGGSYRDLMDSIKNSILSYSDDVVIYPGHGPSSTIGIERRSNPFLLS